MASLARETGSGQDVSTAPPWPTLYSAGMRDILQGLPCATQERVASLTAPSLSIHVHVPEKLKPKILDFGIMNASDCETNAYYSLDGQRDFEDFCEVDIREIVKASQLSSSTASSSQSAMDVAAHQLICRF